MVSLRAIVGNILVQWAESPQSGDEVGRIENRLKDKVRWKNVFLV